MYYECHITINPFHAPLTHPESCEGTVHRIGWGFSRIYGDPILGKGKFQYATKHFPHDEGMTSVLEQLHKAASLLRGAQWTVVREKIELVLYDTKEHE
jgi:hypothetical protein